MYVCMYVLQCRHGNENENEIIEGEEYTSKSKRTRNGGKKEKKRKRIKEGNANKCQGRSVVKKRCYV